MDAGARFTSISAARSSPRPMSPPARSPRRCDRLGDETGGEISVYDANGALIAAHGPPIALEGSEHGGPAIRPPVMRIDLADGRIVLARPRPPPHPGLHILAMALLVAGGVALTRLSDRRPADAAARGPAFGRRKLGRRRAVATRRRHRRRRSRGGRPRLQRVGGARRGRADRRRRRCWPTPATNCARRWRACAWRSNCGRSGRRPRSTRRSSATSPRSTRWSAKSCWPAASITARPTPARAAKVDLLGLAAEEAAPFEASVGERAAAVRSRSSATRRCCAA